MRALGSSSVVFLPPRRAIASSPRCFHTGRRRNNCGARKKEGKKKKDWNVSSSDYRSIAQEDDARGFTDYPGRRSFRGGLTGMCFKRLLNEHTLERLIAATIA